MKSLYLIIVAIAFNVSAQVLIKLAGRDIQPSSVLQQLFNPLLILAITAYGISFILTVFIYGKNQLSIVAPFMAGSTFLIICILGHLIFNEPMTLSKFSGIVLMILGMTIILK
ncbi:hypothetical protein BJP27_13510 [Pseudomonas oryzihabitans]|nr:hypothetical protein BJP27_13510 [Pseudomonas psychrotolerans]